MGEIVKIDEKGRIVIPVEIRDKMGLKKGDNLTLDVKDIRLILSPIRTDIPDLKENNSSTF